MTIEAVLERIAIALEKIALSPVTGNAAPAPAKDPETKRPVGRPAKTTPDTKPEPEATGEVTKKQVGDAIVALIQGNQRAAASKLLKQYSAGSVSELKEADYQAVFEAATAILETA
jgi:hypothetical protein